MALPVAVCWEVGVSVGAEEWRHHLAAVVMTGEGSSDRWMMGHCTCMSAE